MNLYEVWVANRKMLMNVPVYCFADSEEEAEEKVIKIKKIPMRKLIKQVKLVCKKEEIIDGCDEKYFDGNRFNFCYTW